ncbi:MAG: exopolyphosphatase, partial [Acidimicrobiia bacterium]
AVKQLKPDLHLVCDIGGGSTEFVLGSLSDLDHLQSISLDIGSVRMTERYIRSDPPEENELTKMERAIDKALDKAARALPRASEADLIGVAGTVTTLAAVQLGLRTYEPEKTNLFRLTDQQVRRMYRRFSLMTLHERKNLSGIPAGRADVIVAGSAILFRSMARWSLREVTVSEKDILDGLVIEMLGNNLE